MHLFPYTETKKMERLSQEHVQRVFDEQERLKEDLEKRGKNLDSWSKELNKREALTEREKQKLEEEKRKVILFFYSYLIIYCDLCLLFKRLFFLSPYNVYHIPFLSPFATAE